VASAWRADPARGPTSRSGRSPSARSTRCAARSWSPRRSAVRSSWRPKADLSALGTLPDKVRVERYVHQPGVLDDVDVAIHHGGTGTLLACLAVGVTQVVTPQGAHQFMNADQLARLDLGSSCTTTRRPGLSPRPCVEPSPTSPLRARVAASYAEIAGMPSPDNVIET